MANRTRKLQPNTINEETDERNSATHKPLVTTEFVPWSCKLFAQPLMKKQEPQSDPESRLHHEREWRFERSVIYCLLGFPF